MGADDRGSRGGQRRLRERGDGEVNGWIHSVSCRKLGCFSDRSEHTGIVGHRSIHHEHGAPREHSARHRRAELG